MEEDDEEAGDRETDGELGDLGHCAILLEDGGKALIHKIVQEINQ